MADRSPEWATQPVAVVVDLSQVDSPPGNIICCPLVASTHAHQALHWAQETQRINPQHDPQGVLHLNPGHDLWIQQTTENRLHSADLINALENVWKLVPSDYLPRLVQLAIARPGELVTITELTAAPQETPDHGPDDERRETDCSGNPSRGGVDPFR